MSQMRLRAEEVLSQGAAKRRDWNPNPNSLHYKMYSYWLARTNKRVTRENLCHYVRVVVIWAPLTWLLRPLAILLSLAAAAGLIALAVAYSNVALGIVVGVGGWLYILAGSKVAMHVASMLMPDHVGEMRWQLLGDTKYPLVALCVILTLPVVIADVIIVVVLGALAAFLVGLQEEYELYSTAGRWLTNTKFSDNRWLSWIRPYLVFPLALVTLSFVSTVALAVLTVLGVAAIITGLVVLAAWFNDKREKRATERRHAQRKATEAAEIEQLVRFKFQLFHPDKAGDEQQYQAWLARYKRYIERAYSMYAVGGDAWDLYFVHESYVSVRYRAYLERNGLLAAVIRKDPSWLTRMLTGLKDFLTLMWSWILARKWRICPLVELPSQGPSLRKRAMEA